MNSKTDSLGTVRLALNSLGVVDNSSSVYTGLSARVLELAWDTDCESMAADDLPVFLTEKVKTMWLEYRDRLLGRRTLSITLSLPKGGVSLTASTETLPSLADVVWGELWNDIKTGLAIWSPSAAAAADAPSSAGSSSAAGQTPPSSSSQNSIPSPADEKIPPTPTETLVLKDGHFMITVDSAGRKLRAFFHPYDKFGVTVYQEVADAMLPEWGRLEPGIKIASTRPVKVLVALKDGKRKPLKVTGWAD